MNRKWTMGYGDIELASGVPADMKEWIHCCACESEWLGDTAEYDEYEPCPYCEVKGRITDVRHDKCPNCVMGLSSALEYLSNLVDMVEQRVPEDKHYPKAMKTVSDTIEDLLQNGLGLLAGAVEYVCQSWSSDPESTPVWIDDAIFVLQKYGKGPERALEGQLPDLYPEMEMGTDEALGRLDAAVACVGCDRELVKALKIVSDAMEQLGEAPHLHRCPLAAKPRVHIYVYRGVVECDEKPDCVEVVIEYDDYQD